MNQTAIDREAKAGRAALAWIKSKHIAGDTLPNAYQSRFYNGKISPLRRQALRGWLEIAGAYVARNFYNIDIDGVRYTIILDKPGAVFAIWHPVGERPEASSLSLVLERQRSSD